MSELPLDKLTVLEQKLDHVTAEVARIRRYFMLTFWITLITIVAPLVLLVFAIPWFLGTLLDSITL
jgi:hypothetical protein